MPFTQSIDLCLKEHIGAEGLSARVLDDHLARVEGGLGFLREAYRAWRLPLLRLPERSDDLSGIAEAKSFLMHGASDIVFLGTGGSSLGGQALAQAAGWKAPGTAPFRPIPRIQFLDNLDPVEMDGLLANLSLPTARFAAVSKSGGTGETIMQTIAVVGALEARGLRVADHLIGITEPSVPGRGNGLRALLSHYGCRILDHDPGVGGRYSALTNVGLLPAAVIGLDIAAVRAGAGEVLAPVLAGAPAREVPAAVGAAASIGLLSERGATQTVLMAYSDRLERLTAWYVQLWAESLGKDGKGTTPVRALGPVDQHSQLQLFLAGPRDKMFTVVTLAGKNTGPRMDQRLAALAGEPGFGGTRIGDLVAAQGRATIDTFARNGRPVRAIHVPTLDGRAIGALMMHFFLETILAAHLLGVDPFDQPAVEEGKILAKKYLAEG